MKRRKRKFTRGGKTGRRMALGGEARRATRRFQKGGNSNVLDPYNMEGYTKQPGGRCPCNCSSSDDCGPSAYCWIFYPNPTTQCCFCVPLGCFTAETKIPMSDGTEKIIKDIIFANVLKF